MHYFTELIQNKIDYYVFRLRITDINKQYRTIFEEETKNDDCQVFRCFNWRHLDISRTCSFFTIYGIQYIPNADNLVDRGPLPKNY